MYKVYNNSEFITRLYIPNDDDDDLKKQVLESIKCRNNYFKTNLNIGNLSIVKETSENKFFVKKIKIVTFKQFQYKQELKKRCIQLPYPEGLYIDFDFGETDNEDKDEKMLEIRQHNVKIFFDKKYNDFAIRTTKWLTEKDSTCILKESDRIVLEWNTTFSDRLSLLESVPDIKTKHLKVLFHYNFKWIKELKQCIESYKSMIDVCVKKKSICEMVSKSIVHLKCSPQKKRSLIELTDIIMKSIKINTHRIIKINDGMSYGGAFVNGKFKDDNYYLIVLEITGVNDLDNNSLTTHDIFDY